MQDIFPSLTIYEEYDVPFDLGLQVCELRIKAGMTQNDLAKKIGTKQSAIARLENGSSWPSVRFLQKIADALNKDIIIKLQPHEQE